MRALECLSADKYRTNQLRDAKIRGAPVIVNLRHLRERASCVEAIFCGAAHAVFEGDVHDIDKCSPLYRRPSGTRYRVQPR
jgi:hypothetical protein